MLVFHPVRLIVYIGCAEDDEELLELELELDEDDPLLPLPVIVIVFPLFALPLGLSTIAKFKNKVEMPELRGFSMRKAMSVLHDSELKYNIRGNGVVAWQSPTPGTILKKGSVCTIGLK